jgi:type IV secretory pathway TrbL component
MKRSQQVSGGVTAAAHTVRHSDRGGSGLNPKLDDDTQS